MRTGKPRKPSPERLAQAIEMAKHFYAVCEKVDDHNGRLADDIIGPLLWDYCRLKRLEERVKNAAERGFVIHPKGLLRKEDQ